MPATPPAADLTRRLSAFVHFAPPGLDARAKLWRKLVPASAPLATDVCWRELAAKHELLPAAIFRAACAAAAEAADRGAKDGKREITMRDLTSAAEEHYRRTRGVHADSMDRLFM